MKRSSKELKRIARDILNDRYSIPMGAFLLASAIPAVIELPFSMFLGTSPTTSQLVITLIAECLILTIGFVLNAGVNRIHLNMTRGNDFQMRQLFDPFRSGTERFFLAGLLLLLLSAAASLPLIAGMFFFLVAELSAGSVMVLIVCALVSLVLTTLVSITYQFLSFILLEQPQMNIRTVFRECRLLIRGHKSRLFYILLSFLGWELLIVASFGIASLWITPYINETLTVFYLDCTGELDFIPVRTYPNR